MEALNNFSEKCKKIFAGNKKLTFIFLIGCCGILMVSLSELVTQNETKNENTTSSYQFFTEDKESMLEKKLEECISKIKGAGKTEVMLTLDSSEEYFYAENHFDDKDESKYSHKNEIIIIEGESGEKPVILKKSEATVRGVLVICEGGENSIIEEKIIKAVCTLLDIPSNRVSVAEMA